MPVSDVAHLGVVVAHAELLQLGEQFLRALFIEVLDAPAAVARHKAEFLCVGFENAGDEGAAARLEVAQDADLVGETLVGLRSMEDLDHPAVECQVDRRAQGVLDLQHDGGGFLLLGMAYKPNVDDDRESPSYVLMKKLEQKGATVSYNDPYVPVIKVTREHPEFAGRKSVDITDSYDCILIATHHNEYKQFDFSRFKAPLVDTRNCVTKRPTKYYRA